MENMVNINTNAFHDYDIRGIYPDQIDEKFFYHLGKAVARYINKGPIGVGHDNRLSSPSLTKSLINGLRDYGVDVVFLGQISTEMHYFASGKYGFAANVVVSASHNPPQYNGAKIVLKGAIPLWGNFGFNEIKKMINEDLPKAAKRGQLEEKNIFDAWINHALGFIDKDKLKPLKVVVDAGNGMGGPSWLRMKEILPLKIIPLYCRPDGHFPNHIPDPLKDENTYDLQKKVVEEGADLGIAIDGDADRMFLVDEKGQKISGSNTLALLTDYFIRIKKMKGVYMYNVICGRIVKQIIEKNGGTPHRTRVGHSSIKQDMRRLHGILAGEHSGHYYFGTNYNADSSLIAGLTVLQILSETDKSLSKLIGQYNIYPTSGEINFKVADRKEAVRQLKEKFGSKTKSIDDLDGYTFWFKDYWFNVRLSNTQPLMRLNMEADNQQILNKKLNEVITFIGLIGGKRE